MKDEIDLLAMEMRLHEEGYRLICGVDEAGRGPLAGPVYAAAVILPENTVIDGLAHWISGSLRHPSRR